MQTVGLAFERLGELQDKDELTWEEMKELQPALEVAERLAKKPGVVFMGEIRILLESLVGWVSGSKSKWMRSSEAYERAYYILLEACDEDPPQPSRQVEKEEEQQDR